MPHYEIYGDNRSRKQFLDAIFYRMDAHVKDNDLRAERKRKARLLTLEAEHRIREQRRKAVRREIELHPNTIIRKKKGKKK